MIDLGERLNNIEVDISTLKSDMHNLTIMVSSLLRIKNSKKTDIVEEEVKERSRIDTNKVMLILNTSRGNALAIMRKLGKRQFFQFILGDIKQKRVSILLFDRKLHTEYQYQKIIDLIELQGEKTIAEIATFLGEEMNELTLNRITKICEKIDEDCENIVFEGNKLKMLEIQK